MKALFLTFMLLIGSMTIKPQKAEAGIILLTSTGGAAALVISGIGLATGYLGYQLANNSGSSPEDWKVGLFFLGVGLVVLDTDQAVQAKDHFHTIPSYLFDEIQAIAEHKKDEAKIIEDNVFEILLTENEVDVLFETLDGSVDINERIKLRSMLTTTVQL